MLGYTTLYSQLIRFFRHCDNINDFRAELIFSKLVKSGYIHGLLFKYFQRLCLAYKIDEDYCEKSHYLLFSSRI